ncbi:unnamed protein product, partial [Didymodactylos carnosus]
MHYTINQEPANSEREGCVVDPLSADSVQLEQPNINADDVPFSTSALVDVNATNVSSDEINYHLKKMYANDNNIPIEGEISQMDAASMNESKISITDVSRNEEKVYMIPRSSKPTNEYFNPNLLLGLFPTLFPHGTGAIEDSTRPVKVSFKQHIQYLLSYSDKRFERHHSFMFVVFNILQKRNACFNARLMVSNPYYKNTANQIQQLTSQDIQKALGNIAKNTYSSEANPNLNTLLKQIKTVGGKVMGSPQSRAARRTEIHSLIYSQGLPSIFMTINPADIHSPIALYFAGVNLNIDHILTDTFPSTFHRAQIVASHPVAAAKFFNLLITNILETLVKGGVLGGSIKAHYGTVETHGRGSLHLHILLWLDHNMTPSQLKENIEDPEFKE